MSRAGTLVGAADAPGETLRMLEELTTALLSEGVEGAAAAVAPLAEAARVSALPGVVWVGPKDEAIGLAVWEPTGDVGRRVALYLSAGYRSDASVNGFLDALEGIPGSLPIVELSDQLPGVTAARRRALFEPRGFRAVSRLDLGWPLYRPAPARPPAGPGTVRPLSTEDSVGLARLTGAAYSDNPVDRALFCRWKDPAREARTAVDFLLSGELGPWNDRASFGVEIDREIAAATIVNDYHGALIAQVMTDPSVRKRGWASALLGRTIAELQRQQITSIRLVVTRANERAYRLYRNLGFEPVPGADGVSWLHPARLGLNAVPAG